MTRTLYHEIAMNELTVVITETGALRAMFIMLVSEFLYSLLVVLRGSVALTTGERIPRRVTSRAHHVAGLLFLP